MRVAFIGGTGFIGPPAVRRLIDLGHEVTVLHRGLHANRVAGAAVRIVDRAEPDALKRTLFALRPECIIDTRSMCEKTRASRSPHALK